MVVHAAVVSPIVVHAAVVSPIVVQVAVVSPIVVQVAVVSPIVVQAAVVSPAVVQAVAVLANVSSKQVREREGNESVPAQKSRLLNRLFCVFRPKAQKRASLQKFTSTWWSGL
ncbi:hypothetical protein OH784_21350 [Ectobacillus funiculus]|uniref:hypothetical protein n=1 Tax=Ectobacillus funiculus TaxID=137993 RepID=UPI00397CD2D3